MEPSFLEMELPFLEMEQVPRLRKPVPLACAARGLKPR
jgi:hypothetical protein